MPKRIARFLASIVARVGASKGMVRVRGLRTRLEGPANDLLEVYHGIGVRLHSLSRRYFNAWEDFERKEKEHSAQHALLVESLASLGLAEVHLNGTVKGIPILESEKALFNKVVAKVAEHSRNTGIPHSVRFRQTFPRSCDCMEVSEGDSIYYFVSESDAKEYRTEE